MVDLPVDLKLCVFSFSADLPFNGLHSMHGIFGLQDLFLHLWPFFKQSLLVVKILVLVVTFDNF
jgi:hypothetical protein